MNVRVNKMSFPSAAEFCVMLVICKSRCVEKGQPWGKQYPYSSPSDKSIRKLFWKHIQAVNVHSVLTTGMKRSCDISKLPGMFSTVLDLIFTHVFVFLLPYRLCMGSSWTLALAFCQGTLWMTALTHPGLFSLPLKCHNVPSIKDSFWQVMGKDLKCKLSAQLKSCFRTLQEWRPEAKTKLSTPRTPPAEPNKKNNFLCVVFTKQDCFIETDLVYAFCQVDSKCISRCSLSVHTVSTLITMVPMHPWLQTTC